jgi:hypothetical protein
MNEAFITHRSTLLTGAIGTQAEAILDDPIRRHEPDGIVPPETAKMPDSPPARVSVLTEAQGLVHGARNEAYGHPADDYARTAGMFSALLAHKLKEPLTPQEAIMFMICVKLSRQVNKPKRDNAVDGAGYFECLDWTEDELARRFGR